MKKGSIGEEKNEEDKPVRTRFISISHHVERLTGHVLVGLGVRLALAENK